jgi:hypothetical protein
MTPVTESTVGDPEPRRRVHPLDLLAVALFLVVAVGAWTFLFRGTPLPEAVDRVVGAEIDCDFTADHEWKRTFLTPGRTVFLEDRLATEVVSIGPSPEGAAGTLRVRLRVRERDGQKSHVVTQMRKVLRRGHRVILRDDRSEVVEESEVEAEIVDIRRAPGAR